MESSPQVLVWVLFDTPNYMSLCGIKKSLHYNKIKIYSIYFVIHMNGGQFVNYFDEILLKQCRFLPIQRLIHLKAVEEIYIQYSLIRRFCSFNNVYYLENFLHDQSKHEPIYVHYETIQVSHLYSNTNHLQHCNVQSRRGNNIYSA